MILIPNQNPPYDGILDLWWLWPSLMAETHLHRWDMHWTIFPPTMCRGAGARGSMVVVQSAESARDVQRSVEFSMQGHTLTVGTNLSIQVWGKSYLDSSLWDWVSLGCHLIVFWPYLGIGGLEILLIFTGSLRILLFYVFLSIIPPRFTRPVPFPSTTLQTWPCGTGSLERNKSP